MKVIQRSRWGPEKTMNPSVSDLLEAADDENAEYPHAFDRERLLQRLHNLRLRVEEIAGRRFELDDRAQDASFCADLSIQRPGAEPNWIDTVFALVLVAAMLLVTLIFRS